MPGAYTFTYGTLGPLRMLNKYTLVDDDGTGVFEADILVQEDTDADLAATVDGISVGAIDNRKLEVKLGSVVILSRDPEVNTGFLTKATVSKVGSRSDTGRSRLLRFRVSFEIPPKDTTKAGRRFADIGIQADAAGVREVSFAGVWTALAETAPSAGDEKTAEESYAAGKAAFWQEWIDAANDGSGSPILTTSGRWQKLDESFTPEDQNKRGTFLARFREVLFSASPAPDAPGDPRHVAALKAGVFLSGTFTSGEPTGFGVAPSRAFEDASPSGGGSATSSRPRPPREFDVTGSVSVNQGVVDPATGVAFKQDTIAQLFVRPWIVATLKAMFGVTDAVFRSLSFGEEDVATKSISFSASLIGSSDPVVVTFVESIQWTDDRRLSARHIWDGRRDSYDLAEGGREARLIHRVTSTRLRAIPPEPAIFTPSSGVQFERTIDDRGGEVLDPLGRPTDLFSRTVTRSYLKVRTDRVAVPLVPQPLGAISGAGGSSTRTTTSRTGLGADGS